MTEDVIDRAPPSVLMPRLTRRETLVLRELHRGLTLDEIASRLYVSRNTIKTQVRSLYRKLGVSSRSEAVALVDPRLDGLGPHREQLSRGTSGALSVTGGVRDTSPRRVGLPSGPHLVSVTWDQGLPADDAVPSCAALARLAHQREVARGVLDAIEAAIATEVANARSSGANWSEIGAALGMTRQAVRRRFDGDQRYFSV